MFKKLLYGLALGLTFVSTFHVSAESFDVPAKHAIAVEERTGKILYEKDADTVAGVASITKILTVYMVYKEIDQGKLNWDSKVKISDYAYNLTASSTASNVPMEARKYTVKQLVNAAMVASANSAAIALAEKIAGSESKFVDMMSQQLKEWGITDAKLVNSSGLNNSLLGDNIYPGSSETDENMLSATDVAIIARHLVTEYPDILKITSQTTAKFGDITMNTYNLMLKDMPLYRDGIDGLKTGTTDLAGASFVATSNENGMRVISVILNADNWEENDYARFQATVKLLNYVTDKYDYTTILNSGDSYKNKSLAVKDGKNKTVKAVPKTDFKAVTLKNPDKENSLKITTKSKNIYAPLKKGQTIATATYEDSDKVGKGYLDALPSVQLVAKKEVKRSFFLKVWWNHFIDYVNEKL